MDDGEFWIKVEELFRAATRHWRLQGGAAGRSTNSFGMIQGGYQRTPAPPVVPLAGQLAEMVPLGLRRDAPAALLSDQPKNRVRHATHPVLRTSVRIN
jgi:hypothetical protein